jgi:hypothetical protein
MCAFDGRFGEVVTPRRIQSMPAFDKHLNDTPVERRSKILTLLERGASSREIASRLGVGVMTVAGYKAACRRSDGPAGIQGKSARATDWNKAQRESVSTWKQAVTEAKVRIRQAVARAPWPRWQLVTFNGRHGHESAGIVDLLAIRKDFGAPSYAPLKPGDIFQMILIQVKGGSAEWPTDDDIGRLRAVREYHHARDVLLATWKKGRAAQFFSLPPAVKSKDGWVPVTDLEAIFR